MDTIEQLIARGEKFVDPKRKNDWKKWVPNTIATAGNETKKIIAHKTIWIVVIMMENFKNPYPSDLQIAQDKAINVVGRETMIDIGKYVYEFYKEKNNLPDQATESDYMDACIEYALQIISCFHIHRHIFFT